MLQKNASLRIVNMALPAILDHPRNPRVHPDPGSDKWEILKRSLDHDYFDPLVVNERNQMLVSGHLRKKLLITLGFTHADVSLVSYDEQTHLARLVAANELLGSWEVDILERLASDLNTAGIDAALAGWNEKQLAEKLHGPQCDDDTAEAVVLVCRADDLQAEWRVQPGDLYQIGAHRLLCGDSTQSANWLRLLAEVAALDLVWTDPPYNINYDSIQHRRIELKSEKNGGGTFTAPQEILNDHLSDGDYAALLHACFAVAFEITKPGGVIYVAHADTFGLLTRQALAAPGWHVAQCLIWVKNAFTLGRQDYQWQHEPVLYGWKPGAAHYWQGGFGASSVIDDEEKNLLKLAKEDLVAIINRLRNARDTTVIREPRNAGNSLHPTVKPLPLVARQIWNSSRRGDVVGEFFGGSGTTLIAAEQIGRRCFAAELDPKFCAVILQRAKEHGLPIEKLPAPGALPDGSTPAAAHPA